jgi:glycolate oxidase FAD binding subunit
MSAGESLAQRINATLGGAIAGGGIASGGADAVRALAIGGIAPQAAVFPQDEAQVAAVLALANRERWAVVPWGSGSSRAGASAPSRYDIALSLAGLGRVLDHDSDNLTLTAQCGLALAEANRQIRPKHQFLPLGHAFERRTLGGLVAANRTPPQRLVYGDLRDQILGMRVATADGTLVRYGRKVLKNVAGYDMNKLFLGSEGQLGVLVEVTLKLSALPDATGYLIGTFSGPQPAFACAGVLLRSPLQPSGIFILDPAAGSAFRAAQGLAPAPAATTVLAGFAGRGVTVKRQLADGAQAMTQGGATATDAAPALAEPAAEVLERPPVAAGTAQSVRLRLGAAPTELPALWNRIATELGPPSGPQPGGGGAAKVADYGSGRILVALGAPPAPELLAAHVTALRAHLAAQRGYLVVQAAPPEVRARLSAWGDLGGEQRLLQALKARLDANGILAPGRFLS